MKRFKLELEWLWDFYVIYFIFKTDKLLQYHRWMKKKYGPRYCTQEEFDEYIKTL
jgi:hypothetical protein